LARRLTTAVDLEAALAADQATVLLVREMTNSDRLQKITLGDTRASGVRGLPDK
jgi:hypothetical protein